MTNVLYSLGRLPYLAELASALERELSWRPCYWITQPELADQVAAAFPETLRHDFTDANHGYGDPLEPSDLVAAEPSLLTENGHLLRQGLLITARHVLAGSMTAPQQMTFYLARLDYALRVTKTLDLKIFVLNSAPHSVIDFAFYTAFKLLGRPVRMLHLTGFNGMQAILDDAEGLPLGLDLIPSADPTASLSPAGQTELSRLFDREQDHTPWYVTQQQTKDDHLKRFYKTARELLEAERYPPHHVDFDRPAERQLAARKAKPKAAWPRRLWVTWKHRKKARKRKAEPKLRLEDAFKRRFQPKHDEPLCRAFAYRPEGFSAPPINWRQYYTYRDWVLLTKERWRQDYDRLSAAFDPASLADTDYLYFPLHYQPERTTSPEGGLFDDQLLVLRLIAENLPPGWRLLVKEHPAQFRWQTEGELGRWDGYYAAIDDLPGTELVPLEIASERLIQDAAAVVTVTGTVGFEACLGGVPAIVLANPWYAVSGLVLRARTGSELQAALATIRAGWRPSRQAVTALIARLEHVGRRCYLSPSHSPLYPDLDDETNLAELIELFTATEKRQIVSGARAA